MAERWRARLVETLLAVGIYILGLALVWGGIALHLAQERRQSIEHGVEDADNLARGFGENIASAFTVVDQALMVMRSVIRWQPKDFDLAVWARSSAFINTKIMQMSIVDREGRVLDTNLGLGSAPVSIADREHFQVQRDSVADRLFISRPLLGRVSHKLTLNVTRKLFDADGRFAGVGVVSFAPEHLNQFYASLSIGHGRLTLAGTDGVIRARAPDMPEGDQTLLLDPVIAAMARTSQPSQVDDVDGRIIALLTVSGFPLLVTVELPLDGVLEPYRGDRFDCALAGGAVSLAMTAIWLLLLRQRNQSLGSRATLIRALQSISQGLMMVDAGRRIVVINDRAVSLLELPPHLVGENASFDAVCDWQVGTGEFGHQGLLGHETYLLARRFSLEAGSYERETRNGTALEIRTTVLPDGSAVRTYTDITERRRNEQMLRTARDAAEAGSRARIEFLAVMSHEIRTPLNGILGVATLLADCPLGPEEREHVEVIRDSGRHLLDLVNDILDFSKLDADRMELESMPIALAAVLRRVVGMLRPQATGKGFGISLEVEDGVPAWVAGDAARLRQILVNLVGNAIKFTTHGGVRLLARRCADIGDLVGIRFEVHDSGIGIAPEARDKLFKLFTQVDQSISRRFGGTGLGLAICQRLVTLMGGTIGVDSVPGQGSQFWFELRLPLAAPPARPKAPAVTAGRRLRILLAEDNATNRLVASRLLARRGHVVETVEDGEQAFAALRTGTFDLLLTDVMMPVVDGMELTRRVRALPAPFGAIPIIGLTAKSSAADRRDCLAAGMNDYATKPIDPHLLERAIARAVSGADDTAAATSPDAGAAADGFDGRRLTALGEAIGAEGLAEVIDLFRQQLGPQLALLAKAEATQDGPTLLREVHALASTARTLGLERLGVAARTLELSLMASDGKPVAAGVAALQGLADQGLRWLAQVGPPAAACQDGSAAASQGTARTAASEAAAMEAQASVE